MLSILSRAVQDLSAGLRMRRVWIALAQEDIGDQHRRTTLGPLWLLINYLAFAGAFIFVIKGQDASFDNYPAFVATGLFVWFYLAEVVNGGVTLFHREESFIKGTTLPLSVYVMRLFAQTVVRASYALLGCLAILLAAGSFPHTFWLVAIVGLLLSLLATPAAIIILAFAGAYFPDGQFISTNVMRIGMFLTPVFWKYEGSDGIRHLFYHWNPFTYFLNLVREPVVLHIIPWEAFLICSLITTALWIVALFLLGKYSKEIVFFV